MKHASRTAAMIGGVLLTTSPAFGAAYMKWEGVDGNEAKPPPAAELPVKAADDKQQALLLPAVQAAREAAAKQKAEPTAVGRTARPVKQPVSAPTARTPTPKPAAPVQKAAPAQEVAPLR